MPIVSDSAARKRESVVRRHVEAENAGAYDEALLTFARPRDPLSPIGRLGTLAGHPLTIARGLLRRAVRR